MKQAIDWLRVRNIFSLQYAFSYFSEQLLFKFFNYVRFSNFDVDTSRYNAQIHEEKNKYTLIMENMLSKARLENQTNIFENLKIRPLKFIIGALKLIVRL